MAVTMKTLICLAGVVALCASGALLTAMTRATGAPADDPKFDAAQIAKGAELAAIGNCGTCHTAEGGKPFAGGRPLSAPFGTIYSTNITPELDTGIGKWTEAEFVRAMHDGVDREGHDLYPAFPYDHFTKVADEDVKAIYAFVMTRDASRALRSRNDLTFPANLRGSLRAWKALYFRAGRFEPDAAKSAQWNRGAYLAEGLGHCGACHTPRNVLGAEKLSDAYGGGDAERWLAPAMNEDSPAPLPWTADEIFNYLRYGFDARHGIAAGPMVDVVQNLAKVREDDVRAIAAYIADRMRRPVQQAKSNDEADAFAQLQESAAVPGTGRDPIPTRSSGAASDTGATVFEGACATCHYSGSGLQSTKPVPLALTTSVNAPDPRT